MPASNQKEAIGQAAPTCLGRGRFRGDVSGVRAPPKASLRRRLATPRNLSRPPPRDLTTARQDGCKTILIWSSRSPISGRRNATILPDFRPETLRRRRAAPGQQAPGRIPWRVSRTTALCCRQ